MLRDRLRMGTFLVAVFAVGMWLDEWLFGPPYPCWLAISLLCLIGCCRELRQLLRQRGIQTSWAVSYGSVVGVTLSNWIPWLLGSQAEHRLTWPFIALCLANMVVLLREAAVFREAGHAVTTAGAGMLLLFYLGVLGSFVIQLRWLAEGLLALCAHIAAAKCGDIGAYFGGRMLGRHKLCFRLSPGKTIEGSVVGLIWSVLGTVAVLEVWRWSAATPGLSWMFAAGFGLAVGGLAQAGDLVESLIKRDCGEKNASDLMPGFGGVLDVLDSALFSAPLAFLIWTWAGPGWEPGLG